MEVHESRRHNGGTEHKAELAARTHDFPKFIRLDLAASQSAKNSKTITK
jgi:hypothetical protein